MDRTAFWGLIEETKQASEGDCEQQAELLRARLTRLSEKVIISFAETLEQLLDDAYTWELWAAGYLINGGCSDDGFEYFRLWLIAQGEQIFSTALKDPHSLADFPGELPEHADFEELGYVAEEAYEEKTGRDMPDYRIPPHRPEPAGREWKEEEVHLLYPRLAARAKYDYPGTE